MIGNRTKIKVFFIYTVCFLLAVFDSAAQDTLSKPNLRVYLSKDKSSYAGLITVNQIWTRYIWNNPDVNGANQGSELDFALRRSRLIFYTNLMDKVFMYVQLGCDGLSFRNTGNPNISLYNIQTEYILSKDKLHLGFGLNTWNGVSRYNNSRLLEFLVVDNPGFAYPTAGKFDRFGRQLGVYAKGTVSKLHYRVSIAKPFVPTPTTNLITRTQERVTNNLAFKGYFDWQFLDKEGQLFPYMTMNNLGRAKMFNIGAGFYYQPNSMRAVDGGTSPETYDVMLFCLDAFLDVPTRSGGAITSYLAFYDYSFGPGYLRPMSKINLANAEAAMSIAQGPGNSEWEVGTGQILRGEFGYLLPWKIGQSRLQPFGAYTYKNFEALNESSGQIDLGANFLVIGHHLKWTLQYSTRPVYLEQNAEYQLADHKGQLILQTHFFF